MNKKKRAGKLQNANHFPGVSRYANVGGIRRVELLDFSHVPGWHRN